MGRLFLLVDDDMDDAELFQEALGKVDASINFNHALDGRKMFQYLSMQDPKPDIIFLDINLTDLSGWQCLIQLKSHHDYQEIPVIMYSNSYAIDDHEMAHQMKALGLLTKPNNFPSLVDTLSKICKAEEKELEEVLKGM
jgi:DNA-binding NtrC family response regulator